MSGRARPTFGVKPPTFDKKDIHVHVPEGRNAEGRTVGRHRHGHGHRLGADRYPGARDIAMTGEVTLRGRVLPIGGLKEKLLAALRGGLKKVLIPEENAKDLAEIPDNVKNGLEIVPVSRVEQVLEHALVSKPEPIEWDEAAEEAAAKAAADAAKAGEGVTAH
jgi:ATP-dependent Lon protease